MSEWISVKDRLPEKGESVLLLALVGYEWEDDRSLKTYIAYWTDDYGIVEWTTDCDCSGSEHDRQRFYGINWMPLPQPPEK